jgi:hypothetical protein
VQNGHATAIRQQASPTGLSDLCIRVAFSSPISHRSYLRERNRPCWFDSTAVPVGRAIQEDTVTAKGSRQVNGTFRQNLQLRLAQQFFDNPRHCRQRSAQLGLILAASLGNLRLAAP